ncbi:hypothetical protein AURDEDRAFT_170387 [Auricularia subglabra TFB-10046 SS5]|nr:hypothetical protein AURDEDRAFT_170387 [Auricularia subglabra TFB-10046 SS5]
MHILHETAEDVVESTFQALGGISEQNAEYFLFAADSYLNIYEEHLYKEVNKKDVSGLKLDSLVPENLLPRRKVPSIPPPVGIPDEKAFYDLFAYIDERILGPESWLKKHLGPIEQEPRMMSLFHDVRREFNISVATLAARARAIENASSPELATSSPSVPPSPQDQPSSTPEPKPPAWRLFSPEIIHEIVSHCTSFRDILNMLSVLRWRKTAARTVPRINLQYTDSEHPPPQVFAEAWGVYQWFPLLKHLSTDGPLRNSVAPRMPAWFLPSASVDMTARERWAGTGFKFWRTLGALGEDIIPDFTIVNPTEEVATHFCRQQRDAAVRLSFLRNERKKYDVVLDRASGHVRMLRDITPDLDQHVFDCLTFRSVVHLVLADDIRATALEALCRMELTHVKTLELVLDEGSERETPYQPESTRLLQQYRRFPRPRLNCPVLQKLRVSSPTPVCVSSAVVRNFMYSLSGRAVPIEMGRNIQLVS